MFACRRTTWRDLILFNWPQELKIARFLKSKGKKGGWLLDVVKKVFESICYLLNLSLVGVVEGADLLKYSASKGASMFLKWDFFRTDVVSELKNEF